MDLQTICTLSVLGVAGWFVLGGVIWGLKRGMARSINRLITIVLSAVVAFVLSTKVFASIIPTLSEVIKVQLGAFLAQFQDVVNASDSLIQYILKIVLALIAPILYVVFFFVLRAVTFLIYLFLNAFLPSKKRRPIKGTSRLIGMIISIVGGLVIAASILVPLAGFVGFVDDSYDDINGLYEEVVGTSGPVDLTAYQSYVQQVSSNQFVALISQNGKVIFDKMITLNETIDLGKEINNFKDGYPIMMDVVKIDYAGIFDSSKDLDLSPIETGLLPFLDQAENFKAIIAEVLSEASFKWVLGESFMGINITESFPEDYKDAMDGILNKLAFTTEETVVADLKDLVDTVKSLASIYRYMSTMNDTSVSLENLSEDMTSILTNITPGSAEVIKSIVSESVISSVIEDEATAGMVSAIISDTLDAVANMTDEEKAQEAVAITNIMTYITSDRADKVDSDEFVDSILDSAILSSVITSQAENSESKIPVSQTEYDEINAYLESKKLTSDETAIATLEALQTLLAVSGS